MRTVILLLEVSNEDLLSFLSANLRFVKSISLRFFCICCFSFTNLKKSVDFLFISAQTHFLKQYPKGRLNQSSATLPAEAAGNQSESPKSSLNLATRSSCQWPISFIVPKKNLSTSGSSTHCSPPISERLSHSHLTRSATYFI